MHSFIHLFFILIYFWCRWYFLMELASYLKVNISKSLPSMHWSTQLFSSLSLIADCHHQSPTKKDMYFWDLMRSCCYVAFSFFFLLPFASTDFDFFFEKKRRKNRKMAINDILKKCFFNPFFIIVPPFSSYPSFPLFWSPSPFSMYHHHVKYG